MGELMASVCRTQRLPIRKATRQPCQYRDVIGRWAASGHATSRPAPSSPAKRSIVLVFAHASHFRTIILAANIRFVLIDTRPESQDLQSENWGRDSAPCGSASTPDADGPARFRAQQTTCLALLLLAKRSDRRRVNGEAWAISRGAAGEIEIRS